MPDPKVKDTGPVPHLPRPPHVGDIWVLTSTIKTVGGDCYLPGEKFYLVERTDEAPFGFKCPEGNWKVQVKGKTSVWSSIPYMIADGNLVLESGKRNPSPPSRFERPDPL